MPARQSERARPVLTGRALVLGGIVVLLVVLLASPIHRYLASRSDVGTTAQQLQRDRTALATLTEQQKQYGDPAYVQRQARTRLQYAMPGDTVYVVAGKGHRSAIASSPEPARTKVNDAAWNHRLWDSIRAASR